MLAAFKIIFLFLAVWVGAVNVGKALYREPISEENFLVMAVGITGFLVLQFNLYG